MSVPHCITHARSFALSLSLSPAPRPLPLTFPHLRHVPSYSPLDAFGTPPFRHLALVRRLCRPLPDLRNSWPCAWIPARSHPCNLHYSAGQSPPVISPRSPLAPAPPCTRSLPPTCPFLPPPPLPPPLFLPVHSSPLPPPLSRALSLPPSLLLCI